MKYQHTCLFLSFLLLSSSSVYSMYTLNAFKKSSPVRPIDSDSEESEEDDLIIATSDWFDPENGPTDSDIEQQAKRIQLTACYLSQAIASLEIEKLEPKKTSLSPNPN